MMDMLKKAMEKKKKEPMDENYKNAKMSALKDLHGEMGKMIGGGMKQVSVAAPDKEGLLKGLDKAEEVLDEMPEHEEEMPMDMAKCDTPEEIDKMIEMLQMKKMEMTKEG